MEARVGALEDKLKNYDALVRRLEVAEEQLAELEYIKEDFGTKLKDKLNLMEANTKTASDQIVMDLKNLFNDAKNKFDSVDGQMADAKAKFDATDELMAKIYEGAQKKFEEIDTKLNAEGGHRGGGGGGGGHKKQGLLPDKMMIPNVYKDDVSNWRKWKEDVTKYFDEEHEGMKAVMDEVARVPVPVTKEVLEEACIKNPEAVGDKLKRWKHLYRALEKLTDGEAGKVVSTVKDENGFEAWRQLHLRFEPELEAQKNVVLTELHSITAATTIEETKLKLTELRVRIAKVEEILDTPLHEIQKKTALLQILDPITKQHTATIQRSSFQAFYMEVMTFANNATVGGMGSAPKVSSLEKTSDESAGGGDQEAAQDGYLNGFVGKDQCRKCGGFGHWADTCTKGKGKGGEKGKGKSKGPATGCWNCGGDHFQDQCPMGQYASKGGGKKGNKGQQNYFGKRGGKGYKGSGKGFKGKGRGRITPITRKLG